MPVEVAVGIPITLVVKPRGDRRWRWGNLKGLIWGGGIGLATSIVGGPACGRDGKGRREGKNVVSLIRTGESVFIILVKG